MLSAPEAKSAIFFDLYFICQTKKPLVEVLKLMGKKYAPTQINQLHLLKSLVYFAGADQDPELQLIKPVTWLQVKAFFQNEVKKILE